MAIQCISDEFSVISKIKVTLLDQIGDRVENSDGYYISLSVFRIDDLFDLSGISSRPFVNGEAIFDNLCINSDGNCIDIVNVEE